jgi:hypothetical protein
MLAGMLICLEIGRRVGKRSLAKDPQGSVSGTGALQGAVFSLFGLLVGFTFSGAPCQAGRRETHDPEGGQCDWYNVLTVGSSSPWTASCATREIPQLRGFAAGNLRKIAGLPDSAGGTFQVEQIQSDIWKQTLAASHLPDHDPDALKLLVPSLNEMFDTAATRTTSRMMHPPMPICALLLTLALVCSLLAGSAMAGSKQRSWLHIAAFATVYVISPYVILEIEYPRLGSFSVLETRYDQVLVDVRESMK